MKTVVCIMLANGRPEMVKRAVAAFHAQEYPKKFLYIYDTGEVSTPGSAPVLDVIGDDPAVEYLRASTGYDHGRAIGAWRNEANEWAASEGAEIFAHWDSDDWSHPRRLTEQMELLENTRADLVGYRECLFFDSTVARREIAAEISSTIAMPTPSGTVRLRVPRPFDPLQNLGGEAWIYRNGNPAAPIGASFLYPRESWERRPFPANHTGEDTLWLLGSRFKIHAVPSTWDFRGLPNHEPRMICSIHGANTSSKIETGRPEWKREPLFDLYCRTRMEL